MSERVIQTTGLTKTFDDRAVVDGLDLEVPPGSVTGFLGVNGAGKSTTMRMLTGHLSPSAGDVRVFGTDPREHTAETLQRIGYVSDTMNLPGRMSVGRVMEMNAGFFARWDQTLADTLCREFELKASDRFQKLSFGQKRRVVLMQALCQGADLLMMDEPAGGLDVLARRLFLDRVLDIACSEGRTVLVSSHLLTDLERVVDRVVFIHKGRLLLQGNLEELKTGVRRMQFEADVPRDALDRHFNIISYRQPQPDRTVSTVVDFSEERFDQFAAELPAASNVRTEQLNLEDMFVELVGADSPLNAVTSSGREAVKV